MSNVAVAIVVTGLSQSSDHCSDDNFSSFSWGKKQISYHFLNRIFKKKSIFSKKQAPISVT